jgi:hypothetical protein
MRKMIAVAMLAACTFGCDSNNSESAKSAWDGQPECTLRLVAYKTSKHSKYYMEEVSTGTLFYMSGLGGRRIPTIPLGSTVKSRCAYDSSNNRITEFYNHRTSIVDRVSGTTTKSLPGYEHLLN